MMEVENQKEETGMEAISRYAREDADRANSLWEKYKYVLAGGSVLLGYAALMYLIVSLS